MYKITIYIWVEHAYKYCKIMYTRWFTLFGWI